MEASFWQDVLAVMAVWFFGGVLVELYHKPGTRGSLLIASATGILAASSFASRFPDLNIAMMVISTFTGLFFAAVGVTVVAVCRGDLRPTERT